MEHTTEEIKRLRDCINNLISVLALPAIWSSHESSQIVSTLLDVLLGMLRLDFAYARLGIVSDGSPIEMVRLAQHKRLATQAQEIGRALNRWLTGDLSPAPVVVPNPLGEGEVSIVSLRLGLQDEIGVLVAGSQRADFPTESEMLLLRVAMNQAMMGLQEARHLSEQRHAAAELAQRVVERTKQLSAVNEELRREITERERAEEGLQKTQTELAHVMRVTTLGEITASIAHEVNQPLTAVVTNGNACLRWLAGGPPNLEEARAAVGRMIREGNRASEIIKEIRTFVKKTPPQQTWVNLNQLIHETITLVHREIIGTQVALQMELTANLPAVLGDHIQLQQVLLNLIINGLEAMTAVTARPRELVISSQRRPDTNGVLVAVRDCGIGIDSHNRDRLFDAFFTTKPQGLGMGLSISRSIILAHGGRLWAAPNADHGTTVQFIIPTNSEMIL